MISRKSYTDEQTFKEEISLLFSSRFFLGTDSDFSEEDSYYSFLLGRDQALTCRMSGQGLKVFNNVCLHRNCLIDPLGRGQRRFRCGYHGWRYDSNGSISMSPGFDLEKVKVRNLPRYSTASSSGLHFMGRRSPPDVSEVNHLTTVTGMELSGRPFYTGELEHQCNWKLLVENVLDREHLSQVHGSSFVSAGIDSFAPVSTGGAQYTLWSMVQPEPSRLSHELQYFQGAKHHYLHGYVFPNLFLANTNNLVGFVGQLIPLSVSRSVLRWQLYELPALLLQPDSVREKIKDDSSFFAEKVLLEDKSIVEMCQAGLEAEGAEPQIQDQEEQISRFHAMYKLARG